MWILIGACSVALSVCNLCFAFYRPKYVTWITYIALSFVCFELVSEYNMVNQWVIHEDWSALMDVVPSMNGVVFCYAMIMVIGNGIALLIAHRKEKRV